MEIGYTRLLHSEVNMNDQWNRVGIIFSSDSISHAGHPLGYCNRSMDVVTCMRRVSLPSTNWLSINKRSPGHLALFTVSAQCAISLDSPFNDVLMMSSLPFIMSFLLPSIGDDESTFTSHHDEHTGLINLGKRCDGRNFEFARRTV